MPQGKRNPAESRPSLPHAAPRGPEMRIGPFAGGVGVAIWINSIEGDSGDHRKVRSITLSPRRYRDRQTGEWRDSSAYDPGDIPALIYALTKAQEYVITTSIPDARREPGSDDEPAF